MAAEPSSISIPVPAPALGRRKKNVLIPFGGKSQLDANRRLFEWSALHLFEPGDNVFVFHFYRRSAFKSVTAVAGGSSSKAAAAAAAATMTDAHPQRPGFTVINIDDPLPAPHPDAADTKPSTTTVEAVEKKLPEDQEGEQQVETALDADTSGAINDPAEVEWLPRAVSDALRAHRAASPSSFVVVFQMDSAAGPNSAEEAIVEICKGSFETPPDPAHLAIPRPDLVCVGSRGQKFLKRLVLGSVSSAVLSHAAAPTCIYRSNLLPPTAAELATRKKLGPDAGGQRAICIALSGSDASHTVAEWVCQSLLRPTDKVILLHCSNAKKAARRGYSEEHVQANLMACESAVKSLMDKHRASFSSSSSDAEIGGSVMQMTLPETTPGAASDVRDRLIDFLDKTDVNLLVLGHSNRPGGFKTWALGTVPMYAVQHGNCPVLVVNPPEGTQGEYHDDDAAEDRDVAAAVTAAVKDASTDVRGEDATSAGVNTAATAA